MSKDHMEDLTTDCLTNLLRFIPHGLRGCSDTSPINGYGSGNGDDFGPPRCYRCGILDLIADPGLVQVYRLKPVVDVRFERIPWVRDKCPKCRETTDGPNFCSQCGFKLP